MASGSLTFDVLQNEKFKSSCLNVYQGFIKDIKGLYHLFLKAAWQAKKRRKYFVVPSELSVIGYRYRYIVYIYCLLVQGV